MKGKILVLLTLALLVTGCSTQHQKQVSILFGTYQSEYYDSEDGK